ncbi:MAG: large conductance mechanosensitive channel [Solirubrobacterales bacterium]|jgi:large conductance mechanosensitive channel|nr:large conductance mechanosensitive channel [Solirubrobacterales bacterium]
MASLLKGFRSFAFKDDLITAAVGLVMALATFELIQAIVEGLLTPVIAAIVGEPGFFELYFTIGEAVFAYGPVLNAAITFLGTAAVVYFLVVVPYKHYQDRRGAPAETRPCPECTSSISVAAKRCPNCTSAVVPAS